MTYLQFIQSCETYLRQPNNAEIRAILKTLIPEAILEFVRYHQWLSTVDVFEFTTGKVDIAITGIDVDNAAFQVDANDLFRFKRGDTIAVTETTDNDGSFEVKTVNSSTSTITLTTSLSATAETTGLINTTYESYTMPDAFVNEIQLYDSSGSPVDKVTYKEYLEDSASKFAVVGKQLYIPGEDADYKIMYSSKGGTLTDDDDTSNVLDDYSQVIRQWVIYRFLIWYGADESAAKEEMLLKIALDDLKKAESRTSKNGRLFRVSAHNR